MSFTEEISENQRGANFTSNPSDDDTYFGVYDSVRLSLCIIIIIVNLSVVLSSGLLLHKLHTGQQPRSPCIFLGNIALADMILGIVSLFLLFYPHQLGKDIACCISISLAVTTTLVSVYSIGLIGIDRYLYILHGLHYTRYITSQRSRCMVFSTWLLSGLLGFMPIFGLRNSLEGNICWFILLVPPELVLILVIVGIIPFLVILVLYSIILKIALDTISQLNRAANNDIGNQNGSLRIFRGSAQSSARMSTIFEEQDSSSRIRSFGLPCCRWNKCSLKISTLFCESKWKAIKVVVFTTGAFFVTWFPYFVTSVLYAFCDSNLYPEDCLRKKMMLSKPISVLSLCNSLLNPLIYAWWQDAFRKSVKKMILKIFVERFQIQSSRIVPKPQVNHADSIRCTEPENFDNEQRF